MKKAQIFLFFLIILLRSYAVWALPVDLSGFTADTGVTIKNNVITFTEDEDYRSVYFYNLDFYVEKSASFLSFDYSLALADGNQDWLTTVIYDGNNYIYEFETGESGSGSWSADISLYQGKTVSLIFGLESDDLKTGTAAIISDIKLTCGSSEVPEPAAIFLTGAGLPALIGIGRKRFAKLIKNNL